MGAGLEQPPVVVSPPEETGLPEKGKLGKAKGQLHRNKKANGLKGKTGKPMRTSGNGARRTRSRAKKATNAQAIEGDIEGDIEEDEEDEEEEEEEEDEEDDEEDDVASSEDEEDEDAGDPECESAVNTSVGQKKKKKCSRGKKKSS